MIVPPVGGLGAGLTGAATEGLTQAPRAAGAVGVAQLTATEPASAATPNFGSALTEAISSLESSQRSSDAASQALATGTVSDPEAAVTTVEDAALEMQLAAQIRSKATEAMQTIFQTQV